MQTKKRRWIGFSGFACIQFSLIGQARFAPSSNFEPLAAKLLKAKYYLNSSFWEDVKGRSLLYVWRNILDARSILEKGCLWQVESGTDIRVWHDEWLSGLNGFKVRIPLLHFSLNNTVVAALLDDKG